MCLQGRWAPEGGGCQISDWLGRRTKHSLYGCGNLSLIDTFLKPRGKAKEKAQIGQYLLAVGLGYYEPCFVIV